MRRVLLASLLLGTGLGAACTDDAPERAPATPAPTVAAVLPTGFVVTLQQYRADEVAHRIGIQVTNGSDTAVRVVTARLDWPGLEAIEPSPVDHTVGGGATLDLSVDYGAAVCGDPPTVDDPVPADPIVAEVVTADGETMRWPVDDVRGVLARVHRLDCRRQAVSHLVEVAFGRTWTPNAAGDAVTGELVLTRRAATGPARLTGISGSVLINLDVAPGGPTELTGTALAVPVVVTGAMRCEPHALADSKKTYDFQVTIEVGGVDASISVSPDPADEPILFGPVEVTCGLG